MKKLLLSLATLLCGVTAWADNLPTQELKASSNLPSMGTPENQFYVRQSRDGGSYWKSDTRGTTDKNQAGKFAFYAVPGVENCYYIYSIDAQKWVNYGATDDDEGKEGRTSLVSLADNFNANAYWEFTQSTLNGSPAISCYQMRPTVNNNNKDNGNAIIKNSRYANWFQGTTSNTIGLWKQGSTDDKGSAWSLEAVTADNAILMAQEIALAKRILETEHFALTKGADILTSSNVGTVLSSPYTDSGEGSIADLVDGNAGTHWHSNWHNNDQVNGSHYIAADLSSITPIPDLLSFTYTRRGGAANDHATRWAVYGVPTTTTDNTTLTDDSRDGLTLLAIVSTPMGSATTFENTFRTKGFSKFRFYCEATNSNRGYFHIGEFQLNSMTAATSNSTKLQELATALSNAEKVEAPTTTDIETLHAKIATFNADNAEKAAAQALLGITGVGYPTATAEARINLEAALTQDIYAADLQELVAAFKTTTDIVLPEAGRAYRFTFVDYNGNEYKVVANGTDLTATAASDTETAATTFYCQKYTNVNGQERYAFISPASNFLAYRTLNGSYNTHIGTDQRLQSDFSIGSMYGSTSTHIDNDKKDALFGTVEMIVDNRTLLEPENSGCLILKIADCSYDKSTAAYFTGSFTSAIKITEVTDYTPEDNVLIAASTIEPLIIGYNRIGTGIGKYSYTMGNTTGTSFNDFETAIKETTSVIASSDYSFNLNPPTPGLYRIKSMNSNDANRRGKYIQTVAGGDGLTLATETENAHDIKSVVYIDGSNTILSYATGRYLNGYTTQETIGSEGTAWTISENNDVVGAYALKASGHTADNDFLSDWIGSSPTNGRNDGNGAWTFEAVTYLPVPMNTEAGYATMYSPVPLERMDGSEERVNVYTAKLNESKQSVELIECSDGVPANKGVILQYVAGINESDQCVYLPVKGTDITGVDSDLDGTYAATYQNEQGYVLAKPADAKVGLYKTALTDSRWLLKGFKAFLPGSKVTTGTAPAPARFLFDFGTETGIGNTEGTWNEGNSNAIIYDLSGRRVKNAQKGIYIINGKKVIK